MSAPSTRVSLLERLRDLGDQDAWREFERTYRELVLRYALRRGLSAHDAEDVLQSVLLRLARRLPRFEYDAGRGRFRAYLGRTVENDIRSSSSRQDRPLEAVEDFEESLADPTDEQEAMWDEEWTLHHYRRAMAAVRETFPERSLAVFRRLLDGAGADVVAGEFGLSVDAVYKVKQRIRDRLRERIAEQRREEDPGEATA